MKLAVRFRRAIWSVTLVLVAAIVALGAGQLWRSRAPDLRRLYASGLERVQAPPVRHGEFPVVWGSLDRPDAGLSSATPVELPTANPFPMEGAQLPVVHGAYRVRDRVVDACVTLAS
jgi:hypothetical protein